ncbi:MAG TPA: hypothetical protein VF883_05460 [Thermoanaerobaculia bacterium]|jgi:hypothetical protein
MLIIRQEQYDAIRESAQGEFDAGMIEHLRTHFPKETGPLDDAELLALVQEGRHHAWRRGADHPGAVCRFIDVRFVLGPSFDTKPELEWVTAPLRDQSINDADARIEEMAERALQWIARRGERA